MLATLESNQFCVHVQNLNIRSYSLVQIDRAFEVTTQFFTHTVEEKEKYARMGNDNNGYVRLEKEG